MDIKSLEALDKVLAPSMYPMVLLTTDNQVICQECALKNQESLVEDIKNGFTTYTAHCLAETCGGAFCECCNKYISAYWESYEEWLTGQ